MPQYRRSLKSIVAEAVFVVVSLTLIGHLSVNFWEKYFIQSQLSQVRTSLHSLKKNLANIGNAYDNLHKELKLININFDMEKYKTIGPLQTTSIGGRKHRSKYTLDRRKVHDMQVNAAITYQNLKDTEPDKSEVLKRYYNENVATQSLPEKDATTVTRNPQKAAAIEVDLSHENCRHHKHCHKNNAKDEDCPYNRMDSWKF